jgi:hypothetical protein
MPFFAEVGNELANTQAILVIESYEEDRSHRIFLSGNNIGNNIWSNTV